MLFYVVDDWFGYQYVWLSNLDGVVLSTSVSIFAITCFLLGLFYCTVGVILVGDFLYQVYVFVSSSLCCIVEFLVSSSWHYLSRVCSLWLFSMV